MESIELTERQKKALTVPRAAFERALRAYPTPSEAMPTKSFFASKTNWLNMIAGIIALITPILDADLIKDPKVVSIFGTVVAIGNIILRTFSTATPIVPPKDQP